MSEDRPRYGHLVDFGFEVGTGEPVSIPLRHMVVTGQTQEAGKTTTLEGLISRSGVKAIAFLTKRGEGTFDDARVIAPYFREQADWKYVAAILEASRGEKLKFERSWIIRASRGARTLRDVHDNVRLALKTAKGLSGDVYLTLDAYLEDVVPQIEETVWATSVQLEPGVQVMDLTPLNVEMQHLVIRSTLEWVLNHEKDTVVVVPEAWKFIPQGRGTPVKLAAESFIRQAAGLRNYLWLDSQDIAGVEKLILKSVAVWILGVQRESNEVKRTLEQIPAGFKKPKADEIATLGLGQFFVCHGTHIKKVYAQPAWLHDEAARAVAMGALMPHRPPNIEVHPAPVSARIVKAISEEGNVKESEARALRAKNVELGEENQQLRGRIEKLEELVNNRVARAPVDEELPGRRSIAPLPSTNGDLEQTYAYIRDRLVNDPKVLALAVQRPELEVRVEKQVLMIDGKTMQGRVARLIANNFLMTTRRFSEIHAELQRTGPTVNNKGLSVALKGLVAAGFVTREGDEGYQGVKSMKVRVVDA